MVRVGLMYMANVDGILPLFSSSLFSLLKIGFIHKILYLIFLLCLFLIFALF